MKRTILITGASGGIGTALVDNLITSKSTLLLHSNTHTINRTAEHIVPLKADFTHVSEIEQMFQTIRETVPSLDVFINTVGLVENARDPLGTSKWKKTFEINLLGAVECTRRVLPLMKKRGGVIVHIASLAGAEGFVLRDLLAYSVAKAGLLKFTEHLSLMTAPKIRVFSVTPGYVITPIWNSFTNEEKKECTKIVPIQRFIQPKEVAKFVVDLVNNDAITGGDYTIDGGLHLRECI